MDKGVVTSGVYCATCRPADGGLHSDNRHNDGGRSGARKVEESRTRRKVLGDGLVYTDVCSVVQADLWPDLACTGSKIKY